jgi:metal-responsive CopG/Arc/MetJ family transcriptional regulator
MPARKVRMTVTLSADHLEAVDTIVRAGVAESRNTLLEGAIRRQLAASRRASTDAEFAQMANDPSTEKRPFRLLRS